MYVVSNFQKHYPWNMIPKLATYNPNINEK